MLKKLSVLLLTGLLASSCSALPALNAEPDTKGAVMVSPEELKTMLETKDFTFVNVHIPLEGSIPGTDSEIPFDEIENYLDQLPADKDAKIVLYCRSGGMGDTASQTLVDLGYTDVSNLEGGYNAWNALNLPFEE